MARVVVCGYMLRLPFAGNMASFLQYLIGLSRLGHDVVYLEERGWVDSCYDPETREFSEFPAAGLASARELVAAYCPNVPIVFADPATRLAHGMSWSDMTDSIRRCDLLLDIGGMCWLEERHLARRRVLVDCDPLFTQVQGFAFEILHEYDVHFSYGSNLGEPGCTVPTGGVDWLPVAPPVVPDLWSSPPVTPGSPLRTVANWTAYGGVSHDGTLYGQKESEFARVIELPGRTTTPLELALSSADDVVRALFRDAGWGVRDGFAVTRTLDDYRAYIAGSAGEFSVAKHAYVATRSGWFSERSACFLAAGRPVVVQETGFSDWLPTGQGVIGFRTVDEAAAAIAAVAADPDEHAAAALDLVARYFDYRVVLPDLLDRSLHSSVVGMTRR